MRTSLWTSMSLARLGALTIAYAAVLFLSLWVSMMLRFDFRVPSEFWARFWISAAWILPVKIALLACFGQFRSLLTFFSLPDIRRIAWAMLVAAGIQVVVWLATGGEHMVPRGVIAEDLVFSLMGLMGLRTAMRLYRERSLGAATSGKTGKVKRVLLIGAGVTGADLFRELQTKPGIGLEVVAFVDDDPRKIGQTLHGKPIIGPRQRLKELAGELGVEKIIIAMPGVNPAVIKELVSAANEAGLEHDILPSVAQLLHRDVTVNHLRHVEPEDLLNRDTVALDTGAIRDMIHDQTVMVTGAGGSIGSELCRQICELNPAKLILVERCEAALFVIGEELGSLYRHIPLVAAANDVCDAPALDFLFQKHRPSIVFHAAAHKHVPLMENQPREALRNNAGGTEILARAARTHGVQHFVLISTDKAVNPTSVMGATKRLAEMVIQQYQDAPGNTCAWCAVRFGNVLGSSGSVVPIFRQQIARGGPVTLTHPEAARYFMSIGEAVGLILQSAQQAKGGEIFVLDMGEPVKIADLARQMIELSGFEPERDIEITSVGLRPGEKLVEEAIHAAESVEPTEHPKVRRLRTNGRTPLSGLAEELRTEQPFLAEDPAVVRAWLHAKIPEYRNGSNCAAVAAGGPN